VKRIFVAFLIITLLVLGITPAFASQTARNISIFEVEGSDVTMTKGTSKSLPVKTGLKLGSGSTVTTGNNSYCWLLLDDETLVKIDQKSKIQIGKASGDRLSISVLSGAITVDAAAQKGKQSLNVNAGNSALAIRGTLFVVEYTPDKDVMITMLTGSGDVNGNILLAGQTMFIYDQQTGKIHEVQEFNIADSLSRVVMETILSHMDDLINSGVISSGEAENLTEQLEQRIEDRRTEEAAAEEAAESSVANMNLDNNVVQRTEEAPPVGGGGGSGGTSTPTHYTITFHFEPGVLEEYGPFMLDNDEEVLFITDTRTIEVMSNRRFDPFSGLVLNAPIGQEFLGWSRNPSGNPLDYPIASFAGYITPSVNRNLYAVYSSIDLSNFPIIINIADPTPNGNPTAIGSSDVTLPSLVEYEGFKWEMYTIGPGWGNFSGTSFGHGRFRLVLTFMPELNHVFSYDHALWADVVYMDSITVDVTAVVAPDHGTLTIYLEWDLQP